MYLCESMHIDLSACMYLCACMYIHICILVGTYVSICVRF